MLWGGTTTGQPMFLSLQRCLKPNPELPPHFSTSGWVPWCGFGTHQVLDPTPASLLHGELGGGKAPQRRDFIQRKPKGMSWQELSGLQLSPKCRRAWKTLIPIVNSPEALLGTGQEMLYTRMLCCCLDLAVPGSCAGEVLSFGLDSRGGKKCINSPV